MAPRSTRVVPETEVRSPARSFAQSLDNFYAPARDTRGEQSIQQGASAFSGILGEQAERTKKVRNQGEMQQGIQDAMREQAGQELQGVKTGNIFRQNSTYYMMGLNETRGKAAAAKFKSDLALAYQDWDGRHVDDDGSLFREWMNGKVSEFQGTLGDNQYKIAGAMPTLNEVANNFAVQHTAFTSSRLEQESFEAYDEIVSGIFDNMQDGAFDVTDEDGNVTTDWTALTNALAAEADDMYTTDGAAANDRIVESAIRFASIRDDPNAIFALAKAHDLGTLKLSQVNRQRLGDAADTLEVKLQRKASRENSQLDAEEKARKKAMINEFAAELAKDPYAQPKWEDVGDYDTFQTMQRLQESFEKSANIENPTLTNTQRLRFEARMADATTTRERLEVLNEFVQSNPTALSGSDVASYSAKIFDREDPTALFNNSIVKQYRSGFGQLLGKFESDQFNIDQVTIFQNVGQSYYDDFILSAGEVDTRDPAAVRGLIEQAKSYALERLEEDFPQMMREAQLNNPSAGQAVGASEVISGADAAAVEEAARIFAEDAGTPTIEMDGSAFEPESGLDATLIDQAAGLIDEVVETVPETPQVPQATQEVEEITPIYETTEFDETNSPVQGGVYGEILTRFTDGKDDRHTMRSATEVMKSDPEFASEVDALGAELGIDPMAIMAVMDFESGFDPSIKNMAGSGATGLIQFMPKTARSLGTTTQALEGMTRAQQMPYVRRYFKQFGSRLQGGSVDDIYMAVLWPAAIGKPDGHAIFRSGTIAYTQNKGLDTNGDGVVTKYEAASKVARKFYGY